MKQPHPYRIPVLLLNIATVTFAVLLCVYAVMQDLGYGINRARHFVPTMATDDISAMLETLHRENATLKFICAGALIVHACVLGWLTDPRRVPNAQARHQDAIA